MKKYLLYVLLFVAAASCKKDEKKPVVVPPSQDTTTHQLQLKLETKYNTGKLNNDIALTLAGDSIIGVVPGISNQKNFILSFTPADAIVKIGNVVQQSGVTVNDFSKPVTYTYTNNKGVTKDYKLSITNFTGLPILYLTTAGPVVSKDDYVTGSLVMNTNGKYDQPTDPITLQIKGRGNSTWDMPKKPYRLKFDSKASMLGLTAAKNWVLLANYSDKTLVRNNISFLMAQDNGSDFAPHGRYVEVVVNGEYLGNYTLTEQMEVNDGRVAITELKPKNTSADEITGGYLLELDERLDADFYFYSDRGLPFTIKSPDAITDGQMAYISNYVNQTEAAIFADNFADPVNGYAKYINVDSFIEWYLVKEIMKDNDAKDFSSIYYYKDRGGKLGMGPVWDFDLSGGNTDYSDCKSPEGWWIRDSKWFNRLFQDPAFRAKVKQHWADMKAKAIPNMFANINKDAAYINLSQQQNFIKWPILGVYVWPNAEVAQNYPDEVSYLQSWLHTRISWIDSNLD